MQANGIVTPPRSITIGSDEHKELFCRAFIDTHDPYDPHAMDWPEVDAAALARLRAMPFWGEAISTERDVAKKVQALAPLEPDPLMREAIALQGFEEGRHAALLNEMLRRYDIPMPRLNDDPQRGDPLWNFMRVGYGECFDSFFAFGLYTLACDSGLFPPALLKTVEPIVQEEARHILFFVNWIAYCRARQSLPQRVVHTGRCALAMVLQVWTRVKTAVAAMRGGDGDDSDEDDDFMLGVKDSLEVVSSPRQFLQVCLRENDRRLAPYDPRLLRPTFVPKIARTLSKILK
jgi:hypothetical protein